MDKNSRTGSKNFEKVKELGKKAFEAQQQLWELIKAYQSFVKEKGLSEEFKQWYTDRRRDRIIDMKKN